MYGLKQLSGAFSVFLLVCFLIVSCMEIINNYSAKSRGISSDT